MILGLLLIHMLTLIGVRLLIVLMSIRVLIHMQTPMLIPMPIRATHTRREPVAHAHILLPSLHFARTNIRLQVACQAERGPDENAAVSGRPVCFPGPRPDTKCPGPHGGLNKFCEEAPQALERWGLDYTILAQVHIDLRERATQKQASSKVLSKAT